MTDRTLQTQGTIPMIIPNVPSLDRWYEVWMNSYKLGHVKQTTIDTYNALYEKHIRGSIGNYPLSHFRPILIQHIYNSFLEQGYTARYLSTLHTLLSGLFRAAIANGLISDNPCEYTERPDIEITDRRVLSPKDQNRIRIQLQQPRFRHLEPLITTLMGTGLRIGEALGLRWDDIIFIEENPDKPSCDTSVSYLNVRRTLVRVKNSDTLGSHFTLQSPKTKCSIRSIPLQKNVVAALSRQRNLQTNYRSNARWNPLPDFDGLVFSGKKGQPQWRSTIVAEIDTLIRTINQDERALSRKENRAPIYIDRVLPHAFRHTFATRCLEAGIPPKVVQHWLGHASIKMTLDLYTHVNPSLSSRHMQILEASMNSEVYIDP